MIQFVCDNHYDTITNLYRQSLYRYNYTCIPQHTLKFIEKQITLNKIHLEANL